MDIGQKAARVGLDSEKDIVNKINAEEAFRDALKVCMINLGFTPKGDIAASKTTVGGSKTDIFHKNRW